MQSVSAAFTQVPMDWMIIGVFFIIMSALALRSGTRIVAALALALPAAAVVVSALPSTAFVSSLLLQFSSDMDQAIVFGVVFGIMYLFVLRMLGQYMYAGSMPVKALIAGAAGTVVALVFWLQVPALSNLWHFGPLFETYLGPTYRIFWLLVSYIVLSAVSM